MFHDSRYGEECSHGHGWYFFEDGCAIAGCENAPEIIHIDNEGVVRKSTVLRDPEPECTGKIPGGEVPEPEKAYQNTDRELWRAPPGDYYADSIHVTGGGGIGMNVGGFVVVMPIRDWHKLAKGGVPEQGLREPIVSKAWCIEMALREGELEVGAGPRHDYLVHETISAILQCSMCGELVRAALERPRPAPPAPEPTHSPWEVERTYTRPIASTDNWGPGPYFVVRREPGEWCACSLVEERANAVRDALNALAGGAALPPQTGNPAPEPSETAIEAAREASAHTGELGMADHLLSRRTTIGMLRAAYAVDRGVSSLRAPQKSGPWTWDTAPAALKQIRADAMRLGKAGERIVLLVDTLVPRVQHVNAVGSGAETPPQPDLCLYCTLPTSEHTPEQRESCAREVWGNP